MQRLEIKPREEITVVNVVCTADLKQSIDIASFNEYKHLSSNLELYRCGYVKDDVMRGRVTVFRNGKLISVGTRSIAQAIFELKKASKILQKYGLSKAKKITPIVRNIVAHCILENSIHLEKLARALPRSMYEPDQFPGIIFRIQGSVVALIFASGSIIMVGSKSYEELNSTFFELVQRI